MTHRAYYNEHDKHAAQWLRNLISMGEIAPGEVDERSILDVRPDDLVGYTQCHFFAGVGTFSKALRDAGWSDDRPIWTGSCPCQPFSSAGRGSGFADERHLWPAFHHLIRERRPPVVIGEQVASTDGLAWLDLVQADLEGEDYACGVVDSCAAGFGAPHIRQRLYWFGADLHELADVHRSRRARLSGWIREVGGDGGRAVGPLADGDRIGRPFVGLSGLRWAGVPDPHRRRMSLLMGHPGGAGLPVCECSPLEREGRGSEGRAVAESGGAPHLVGHPEGGGLGEFGDQAFAGGLRHPDGAVLPARELADAAEQGWGERSERDDRTDGEQPAAEPGRLRHAGVVEHIERPGPVNGYWRGVDWLFCRDGKWRPAFAGSSPLALGSAFKMGSGSPWEGKSRTKMLRGYGNGIVLPQATEFAQALRWILDDA